jgi:acyl-CoA synthetase (AMP-forming)/AMP-acid ligase II
VALRIGGLHPELEGLPATVPEALARRRDRPHDDLLVGIDARLTYREADDRSLELAGRLLAAGVGKGTRLGLLHANGPDWVVTWLAAARIGALTVPLSTFSPPAELARTIRHADVQAVVSAPRFGDVDLVARLEDALPGLASGPPALEIESAPFLRWAHIGAGVEWSAPLDRSVPTEIVLAAQAQVVPSDPLALISTSGTTAAPKAVLHTHGSLVRHAAVLAAARSFGPDDRIYSPMPFFWVGGLTMLLLSALTSGAGALIQERFDAEEALVLCERERATWISCWPNAARSMAEHPTFGDRKLAHVRGGTLVAALPEEQRPMAPDLASNLLGMSETGGPHTSPEDPYGPLPESLRGTFGRTLAGMEHLVADPVTGAELPVGEEGELFLRGAFLMDGLYKREPHDVFTPDGWYPSGDLGWFGADGHLRFTGRRTSMIKSAGSNVAPAEVVRAIAELDGVREVFVLGIPAGDRGEDVAAIVVVDPGAPIGPDEVDAAARERLSSYKVPRHCRVLEPTEVPMLPTGKPDLVQMRGWFE